MTKKKMVEQTVEQSEMRDLTDYILAIYLEHGWRRTQINWTMIMAQVKNILAQHPTWTYATIQFILEYMKDIENVNFFSEDVQGSVVNLVPFYAISAEQYWNDMEAVRQATEEYVPTDVVIKHEPHKRQSEKRFSPTSFD